MIVTFDTNILVYATASKNDLKAIRARDLNVGWIKHLIAADGYGVFQRRNPQGSYTDQGYPKHD